MDSYKNVGDTNNVYRCDKRGIDRVYSWRWSGELRNGRRYAADVLAIRQLLDRETSRKPGRENANPILLAKEISGLRTTAHMIDSNMRSLARLHID